MVSNNIIKVLLDCLLYSIKGIFVSCQVFYMKNILLDFSMFIFKKNIFYIKIN